MLDFFIIEDRCPACDWVWGYDGFPGCRFRGQANKKACQCLVEETEIASPSTPTKPSKAIRGCKTTLMIYEYLVLSSSVMR